MVKRQTRSLLTVIGIFIGIAAVVAIVSLGQGMQRVINQEFEKAGANRIVITPGGLFLGPVAGDISTAKLTEDDVEAVRKVRGMESAYGILNDNTRVVFKDSMKYVSVWGIPTSTDAAAYIESIGFFEIEEGRQLRQSDQYSVVIGATIADGRFDRKINLRDTIEIKGRNFRVVGIQKKSGTFIHDSIIRIPKDVARDIFDKEDKVDTIFGKVLEGYEPSEVADRIKKDLADFRGVKEGEEDFSISTSEQTIQNFNTLLNVVQIFLIGIALISLIVGGVGIMNTMYTAVLERTPEIGIMKAIGAKNSDVLWIFLIESGMLGLVGGAVGVFIGLILSKTIELIAINSGLVFFRAYMGLPLILGSLCFSFVVGALSGALPAKQAAKMNPVDALSKIK